MNLFDWFQLAGGIILSFGFIPQIIQIIKTKSVTDINLSTQALVLTGVLMMEAYAVNLVFNGVGLMFLITNSASSLLGIIMVILKLKYNRV